MFDDTIAAIATPVGVGGLAIIRISGPQAAQVADKVFVAAGNQSYQVCNAASHTLQFGYVIQNGKRVDEVILGVMRGPRTFTKEDVVEITCHGGVLPTKMTLDAVLLAGARLAEPGEFTRRAFLNGRIDLAQAEAVADVIQSRTELALQAANEQLAGKLSRRINELRDGLIKTLAHIEAHIDFPDEDISPDTKEGLLNRLQEGLAFVDELLRTANEGQILRKGIRAAIIGRPNAGKSSLLNQLLGRPRAIVSAIPGTTRDTIEETANIRGLPIIFIDTAGLREARDEIEIEGIRRSRESLEKSEIILQIVDGSESFTEEDTGYLGFTRNKPGILVINKADLPRRWQMPAQSGSQTEVTVNVSCATGEGIEQLKNKIKELAWAGEIKAEMLEVMINSRHQEALTRARVGIDRALNALSSDETLELVAMELRIAVNAIGEIVGKTSTEDLLDMIFSQFCIGK